MKSIQFHSIYWATSDGIKNFWCLVERQVTWKKNQTSNIDNRPTCCFCTECCCEWRWWSEIKLNNASDREWCQVESKLQAECRGIYDLIENLLMLIDNFTRNIVEVIMISFMFLSFVCLSVGLFGRRGWLIKQPLHNKALRQTRSWDGNARVCEMLSINHWKDQTTQNWFQGVNNVI